MSEDAMQFTVGRWPPDPRRLRKIRNLKRCPRGTRDVARLLRSWSATWQRKFRQHNVVFTEIAADDQGGAS